MTGVDIELVIGLLRAESTLALATTSEDGSPRVAPVFYFCGEDLRLYWFSSPASDHGRNLKRNPAAAGAVYAATNEWNGIRGVQVRGTVSVVTSRARRRQLTQAYIERFHLGTIFRAAISRSSLYEFRPSWLRYLDNSKHFGYKVELTIPPD